VQTQPRPASIAALIGCPDLLPWAATPRNPISPRSQLAATVGRRYTGLRP